MNITGQLAEETTMKFLTRCVLTLLYAYSAVALGAASADDVGADGLGLPVSSAAAGDGVSSDPARHVASTSNVGEARCIRQR